MIDNKLIEFEDMKDLLKKIGYETNSFRESMIQLHDQYSGHINKITDSRSDYITYMKLNKGHIDVEQLKKNRNVLENYSKKKDVILDTIRFLENAPKEKND